MALFLVATAPLAAQDPPAPPTLSLSLDEALAMAARNNLGLRAAALQAREERLRILEALGQFDPTFFAEGDYGRQESLFPSEFPLDPQDPFSPTVTRIISQVRDSASAAMGVRGVLASGTAYDLTFRTDYSKREQQTGLNPIYASSVNLTVTQPLLRGAWSAYGEAPVELARLGAAAREQGYRTVARETLHDVARAFFDLQFAIEDLEVKKGSLSLAEEQVNLTRVRVETGSLAPIEVTSAASARAARVVDLVTAEAAVVEAEDRLRRLVMDFDEDADWEVRLLPRGASLEVAATILPLDALIALAERHEPELLQAHLSVAQARVRLLQAESEEEASLDLVASGSLVGLRDKAFRALADAFSEDEGAATYSIGLRYEVPLGNRTARGKRERERVSLLRASLELADRRNEVIFQLRDARRRAGVAERETAAREEALRLAEEEVANARTRHELEAATLFEVSEVMDRLGQRRTEVLRARLDHRLALLELSRVIGVPLDQLVAKD